MKNEETIKMRKTNMKIFPIYKTLAWDYLFFYTIDFLFLTEIKNISAAKVILKESFYSFFSIILQIPANIIVEFLGRRNSLILGNVLNCLYMVVIMLSRNLGDLILAEFICAVAFSIKNIAQPSLLNESIPPSKYKSKIYSRINAKGASGYHLINAISKIIAGFLFTINGYIPTICSLFVLIFVTILSIGFVEPIKKSKSRVDDAFGKEQLKDIKDGFAYVLKSERLKALIICTSLISTLYNIAKSYNVSLLKDLNLSSIIICSIGAVGSFVCSYGARKQEAFHNKFRNKSLIAIAFLLSASCLITGIYGIISAEYRIATIIIVLANLICYFCQGVQSPITEKYLRNFANKEIDTKIFAAKNLIKNIMKTIGGVVASFLIDKTSTAYCLIIVGLIFTILYILVAQYMKTRVGLKPEDYSKEERKYDEFNEV